MEGAAIYEKKLVIHDSIKANRLGKWLLQELAFYFTSRGYFYAYSFTSNPISNRLLEKVDGFPIILTNI